MAEDFPREAACHALETYFRKPRKKGATVEPRPPLPEEFWSCIPEWSRMREQCQEGRG
jgi:hypothetical protein